MKELLKHGAALVLAATTAVAQEQGGFSAGSSQASEDRLAEIVVTAQKRSEDVDKVPISISVVDRAAIEAEGIRDINDVVNFSPGVDYQSIGNTNFLAIRGISNISSSVNGYATVGLYIDDTPIQARSIVLANGITEPLVFDLDRVEVLRGPQGTLFGAGAEGGAIRFITAAPSLTEDSGYARVGGGFTEHGAPSYEAGAAFGGPIVQDVLGFRVSAWHARDGGYIDHDSAVPGGVNYPNSNWKDSDSLRLAITYAPTSSLRITPSFFYQHTYTNDISTFEPAGSSAFVDPFTQYLSSLNPNYSNVSEGKFVDPLLHLNPMTDQWYLPALKIDANLSAVDLVSNTSYFYRRNIAFQDWSDVVAGIVAIPWPTTASTYANNWIYQNQNVFTQEIRAQSVESNRPLRWTIGAFYTDARQDFYQYTTAYGEPAAFQAALSTPPLPPGNVYIVNNIPTADIQEALFGEATYQLTPIFGVTAGLRVARDTARYTNFVNGPLEATGPTLNNGSLSQTAVDPKVSINIQLDDKNLLYVSATKGDRIGGLNTKITYGVPGGPCDQQLQTLGLAYGAPLPPFRGDSLWSYEIGSKNSLFNDRMRVEASVFYIEWSNIQEAVYLPICGYDAFTANVGKAAIKGFDLQLNTLVTEHLKAGLSVGYTDAKNTNTTAEGGLQAVTDGQQINSYSTPWTIVATTEYGMPLGRGYRGYLRLDDEYHSNNPGPFAQYNPLNVASLTATAFTPNPATNIMNLHIGTTWKRWNVAAYVKNLLDGHPILYNNGFSTIQNPGGPGAAITFRPRTIGATVEYKW
jgi:iron complex outermembrane receptor protein